MKNANINEEQSRLLTNTIANTVYNLKRYDAVECITMFFYKKLNKNYVTNTDMLRINIIVDSYDDDLFGLIDDINNSYGTRNNKELYGLKINLSINFKSLDDDISYKAKKDLYNSTILYDKDGSYFELQDNIKNNADYTYEYCNKIDNKLKLRNIRK